MGGQMVQQVDRKFNLPFAWRPLLNFDEAVQSAKQPSVPPTPSPEPAIPTKLPNGEPMPSWGHLLLGPLYASPEKSPVPQATTDAGKTIYKAKSGETLADIARNHKMPLDALKAANPSLLAPGSKGAKVVVFDPKRAELAVAQTKADDPRKALVEEMFYATKEAPTPSDAVDELKVELKARRPGDTVFATAVDDAAKTAGAAWQAQGRTHAVFDPLYQLSSQKDALSFIEYGKEIHNQFAVVAATTPTKEAIESHKQLLLAYGPQDQVSREAVETQAKEFLELAPQRAADEVKKAYESATGEQGDPGPAYLAAKKLRELTDPEKVDPLTAALILEASDDTVSNITTDFVDPQQSLWNDEDGKGVKGEYNDIYQNLSAAADSAHRSPLGQESIDSMAHTLQAWGADRVDAKTSAANGSGCILSLAIATELRLNGDDKAADRIEKDVLTGIDDLKNNIRGSVNELGQTALPLTNPSANWDGFLPPSDGAATSPFKPSATVAKERLPYQQDTVSEVESDIKRINRDGYHLTRAMAAVSQYAPQLQDSPNKAALEKAAEAPDLQKEPQLSLALGVSSQSMVEAARMFNLEGLKNATVDDPSKIIVDWSWPARTARNHIQADIKYKTDQKPFGIGLSLYGTGTYIWGATNQWTKFQRNSGDPGYFGEAGWRNLGFLGLYAAGTVIEGTQVVSQILARSAGFDGSEKGWQGFMGRTAADKGVWSKVFTNHLRAFGWWNVAGTANYALQKDWARTAALGAAAGGTLLSTYPGLANALRVGKFGGVVGTALTLLGSIGLSLLDKRERAQIAAKFEPNNKDFLVAAGVRPEIADILADHDDQGFSVAGRLAAMAESRGTPPQEVLEFLNKQDPGKVRELVDIKKTVEPGDDGNYPLTADNDSYVGDVPPGMPSYVFDAPNPPRYNQWPESITGLSVRAGDIMPGFPVG